ncbi:MAG: hypothetical protein JNM27_02900 [Leptospirales bacterium]|nr:hypothetical protein [Leptospirales bacterium]
MLHPRIKFPVLIFAYFFVSSLNAAGVELAYLFISGGYVHGNGSFFNPWTEPTYRNASSLLNATADALDRRSIEVLPRRATTKSSTYGRIEFLFLYLGIGVDSQQIRLRGVHRNLAGELSELRPSQRPFFLPPILSAYASSVPLSPIHLHDHTTYARLLDVTTTYVLFAVPMEYDFRHLVVPSISLGGRRGVTRAGVSLKVTAFKYGVSPFVEAGLDRYRFRNRQLTSTRFGFGIKITAFAPYVGP